MFFDGSRGGAWDTGRDVLGVDGLVGDEVDDFEEELFGLVWFVSGSGGFGLAWVRCDEDGKGSVGEVGRREEGKKGRREEGKKGRREW